MKRAGFLLLILLLAGTVPAGGIDVKRFERLHTAHGLSQNSVLSMYCDHRGFMWFGTFNGLNRFDGYNFKIYKAIQGKEHALTNNRIISIWEDDLKFLWVKSYDGYVHYLDVTTDQFTTFPRFHQSEEEKTSTVTCFTQAARDQIWLGTSNAGIYHLRFDSLVRSYQYSHYISRGTSAITNNQVNFILYDKEERIWIGTKNGLNLYQDNPARKGQPDFKHHYVNKNFTAAAESGHQLWFGTENGNIIIYDKETGMFSLPFEGHQGFRTGITHLSRGKYDNLVIGTARSGLYLYYPRYKEMVHFHLHGSQVTGVFEDSYGQLWINTENFGVTRVDPVNRTTRYYQLTPDEIISIVDDERQYFYEDSRKNLWIGLHGAGLAQYERPSDSFRIYKNDPEDPFTLSSNYVHCISEDQSGLLWVGTVQFNGGISKVIPASTSLHQIIPSRKVKDLAENVIRCIFQDNNGYIWMASKSGTLYIYDPDFNLRVSLENIPVGKGYVPGFNVYSIFQDEDGYIWLGSKGGGVAVSTFSLFRNQDHYHKLRFVLYTHDPSDPNSLSSDMVYSITSDQQKRIWIGTYGNGLNIVQNRNEKQLLCRHIKKSNSNLSSDEVRQVFEDSRGNIWIATIFGLNLLTDNTLSDSALFRIFNYDPFQEGSISYNDIIHMFEDSRQNMWFATYGAGVNLLESLTPGKVSFQHYNETDGLANDAVFGILEDMEGNLWFSTDHGISRFDYLQGKFESYDENNGLISSSFNENACFRTRNGQLLFGSINGVLVVYPELIWQEKYPPTVILTNFQLFNKDVDIHARNAPFKTTIETTREIRLKHNQSSFSIEYAALSFFDPGKNHYSFRLENWDREWNEVKNQRKATYTNLPPGTYRFLVKATDWTGATSNQVTSLQIIISPPWWKTTPAFLVYILLGLVVAELTRRILTKYQRMQNDLRVERRVNEIKLQFFTNISHEIRTPLTLILGPLEDIMKSSKLPVHLRDLVGIMNRNGQRMLRLVNQLLDFRKIQNNKIKLNVREIDLTDFVAETCKNFEHLASRKNIQYRCNLARMEKKAWFDPEKIDIVLFNILSNAMKFTPRGKAIQVLLEFRQGEALITISDEGSGIPEAKLPELFNRFASFSTDEYFTGTGIGLSLSRELIRLHGGDIEVNSTVGIGSTFVVRFPVGRDHFEPGDIASVSEVREWHLSIPSDELILTAPDDEPEIQQAERFKKLLVVEDHEEVRQYISSMLDRQYTVMKAQNGQEGLEKALKFQPDLILTDVMMPVMDGIRMTRKLKSDFETSHIPIVILTAKSNMNEQIEGIEAGAEAYVLKPFNTTYLKAVIGNLIKQREKLVEHFSENREYAPGDMQLSSRDEEFIRRIIRLIEENYSDPGFHVESLAEMSGAGRTVFYHKIKGLTGFTPVEFLRRMRLKIASRLLLSSGYNVSEVAYMTGFNDEKYFSRCFKELFGLTPSQYKSAQTVN